MDPFETRLQSIPLRKPSAAFGCRETLGQALRAAHRRPSLAERIKNMTWQSKVAALASLSACALAVSLLFPSLRGDSVVFAQVVDKLQTAQTLSFDSELRSMGDGKPRTMRSRNYYLTPGKHRSETRGEGGQSGYVVFNFPSGKVLMVDNNRKEARLSELKGGAEVDIAARTIEDLRALDEQASRSLGEKQIDGVRAKGFVVEQGSATTTVWANETTGNPIRIEIVEKSFPGGPVEQVWTNIALNEPLDPQLFSVEPPPGYAAKPFLPVDLDASPAEHVSKFLKIYQKHVDGEFPTSLQDAFKTVAEKIGPPNPDKPPSQELIEEMMMLSFHSAAIRASTAKGKQGEDWQYFPGRVPGEQGQVVFWCRDKTSDKYLAVFGDLHVESVAKDDLPPLD